MLVTITTFFQPMLISVPSAAPQGVAYSRPTTPTEVTFTWNAVPCAYLNGAFVNYVYRLEDARNTPISSAEVTDTSVTLNIDTDIDNHFRVAVVNNYGTGPYSDVVVVPGCKYFVIYDNVHFL